MNLSFSPVVAVVTHSGEEAEECTSQFAPSVCVCTVLVCMAGVSVPLQSSRKVRLIGFN